MRKHNIILMFFGHFTSAWITRSALMYLFIVRLRKRGVETLCKFVNFTLFVDTKKPRVWCQCIVEIVWSSSRISINDYFYCITPGRGLRLTGHSWRLVYLVPAAEHRPTSSWCSHHSNSDPLLQWNGGNKWTYRCAVGKNLHRYKWIYLKLGNFTWA